MTKSGNRARRAALALAAVVIVGFAALMGRIASNDAPDTSPNILVLVADDLGVDWAPCFGNNDLMPNVERLCKKGVVFERAYSTPSCSPSRATILTGRYALRTGAGATSRQPGDPPNQNLRLEEVIIPEMLDQIGGSNYRHGAFGKWHLSDASNGGSKNPILAGFQNYYGTNTFNNYYEWPKNIDGKQRGIEKKYKTSAFIDEAISWIGQNEDRPWFAWVAFYNPHTPWHLPPPELHDYDHLDPNPVFDFGDRPRPYPEAQAYYSAMLQALDTEIGRLLGHIDENIERETYIIFLGDNGTSPGVAPSDIQKNKFKSTIYEGGIHVPLVISGPSVAEPNRRENALVNSTDLFATIIELAGGKDLIDNADQTLDAVSLVPYLQDRRTPDLRSWAFVDTGNAHKQYFHAVIEGEYKLIVDAKRIRLFNISKDPNEEINLLRGRVSSAAAERGRALFSRFVQLYRSEENPYTDVEIESLVNKYQSWLCANGGDQDRRDFAALFGCLL